MGVFVCLGSDKIGHFFQQGHMLYEITTSPGLGPRYAEAFNKYTEGLMNKMDRRLLLAEDQGADIVRWLEGGTFTFYGFPATAVPDYKEKWGGNVRTGVPLVAQRSEADNEANRQGMQFWKDLVAGKYDGSTKLFNICTYINSKWVE